MNCLNGHDKVNLSLGEDYDFSGETNFFKFFLRYHKTTHNLLEKTKQT